MIENGKGEVLWIGVTEGRKAQSDEERRLKKHADKGKVNKRHDAANNAVDSEGRGRGWTVTRGPDGPLTWFRFLRCRPRTQVNAVAT